MATSSIFTNIKITDTQKAEAFAEALDASAHDPKRRPTSAKIPFITSIDEIKKFMEMRTTSE